MRLALRIFMIAVEPTIPPEERREALALLSRTLAREAHVLERDPTAVSSHLHNMLFLDEGQVGVADALLALVGMALTGRHWLRLTNRPATGRAALLRVLDHRAAVVAVAWSPDGRKVASAGGGWIRLWDADSGRHEWTVADEVGALAWAPAPLLVSASRNGTVRVWDAVSGEPQVVAEGDASSVRALAWSPSGTLLALATETHRALGSSGEILVFIHRRERRSGDPMSLVGRLRLPGPVNALGWSPSSSHLALSLPGLRVVAGTPLPMVSRWEIGADRAHEILKEESAGVYALGWLADGCDLLTGEGDGISVWDVATGRRRTQFEPFGAGSIRNIALSGDARTLALVRGDGGRSVQLWDIVAQRCRGTFGHVGFVNALAWSPDGQVVSSGDSDGRVSLWGATVESAEIRIRERSADIGAIAWSPDGSTLAAAGINGIALRDGESGTHVRVLDAGPQVPLGIARSLEWSPNGEFIALMDERYEAYGLHFVAPGTRRWRVLNRLDASCLAWSPDSATLASNGIGSRISLWDTTTARRRLTLKGGHTGDVKCLAWSPDGSTLASGSRDHTIRCWKPATLWKRRRALKGHTATVRVLSWSPDGTILASSSGDGTVRLWHQRDPRSPIVLPTDASLLAWAPDGLSLASAARREVCVWNTATGHLGAILEGHTGPVWALAWSPDGAHLASAGEDLTVRLWDASANACLAIAYCLSPVHALKFSDDDRVLRAADNGSSTDDQPIPYLFEMRV